MSTFTFPAACIHPRTHTVVVVIGVFSISEIWLMLQAWHSTEGLITQTGRKLFNVQEMLYTAWGTLRSSVVGFVVGVLPGAGATIASAMTYAMEKRLTDKEGTFGHGDIRGVAAPEAANNSAAVGPSCRCPRWACPARAPRR